RLRRLQRDQAEGVIQKVRGDEGEQHEPRGEAERAYGQAETGGQLSSSAFGCIEGGAGPEPRAVPQWSQTRARTGRGRDGEDSLQARLRAGRAHGRDAR